MTTATTIRSFARPAAAVFGLVYLVLGVAGFLTPETAGAGHETSHTVWIFSSSGPLNIVHTVVGLLGLLATRRVAGATAYCLFLFFGFAGMTAYGMFATAFGSAKDDPVNLNWADNWLHGITALVALVVAIAAMRTSSRPRS